MEDVSDLLRRFWETEGSFTLLAGMAAAIAVFVIEIVLLRRQTGHSRKEKQIELAVSRGHVVRARRIKAWDDDETGHDVHSWFHAVYVYDVNGRTLKYRYRGKEVPPVTKTLYYLNDPRKTFDSREQKNPVLILLLYILPLAAAVAVINLLGGI